jgi:2-dehydropantoate 2-reductase
VARILVAGSGALGSVIGGLLRKAGHDITLLGRALHLDAIDRDGLRIEGIWGEHLATGLRTTTDASRLAESFDAILVTVKSYHTREVARAMRARLVANGVVISLQNGLGNAEALVAEMGPERVLAARVIFGAEVVAPGRVRVTVYADPVLIGTWPPTADPQRRACARDWASRFAASGIPTEFTDDVASALWGKVLYNAALNPLGALLGVHYGALGENPQTRAIMDAVIAEAFSVALAEGVRLPWTSAADYCRVLYERLLPSTFLHRSSMVQDIERGRPTEIDAINGEVWRRGAARGLSTPANELLTRLIHARETIRAT